MSEPVVGGLIPEQPDLPHRLGRHVHHDPRSRAFAFTAPEPRPIVDVAWKRLVPAYDQGDLGSCTARGASTPNASYSCNPGARRGGVGGGRFYQTWDDYVALLADQGDYTILVP